MTTLTICSHKGGTGKTTTAVNLAAALGLTGHRTLLIDLDPQGFLTSMLGLEQHAGPGTCLDLFESGADLRRIPLTRVGSVDVLPSSTMMTSRMRHLNKATDVFFIREALARGHDYDIVLFDTAAAITVYSLNALVASHGTLIPVTPEYQPVMGAEQTAETIRVIRDKLNPQLQPPFFVLTQVDARRRVHEKYRDYLRRQYPDQILPVEIRTCSSLANSYRGGATVFDLDLHSRGAQDYARLTDILLPLLFASSGDGATGEMVAGYK
jgi:chromosome partitioning protein